MKGKSKTQKIKKFVPVKTIPMICSWCNKLYHFEQVEVIDGKKTRPSHGICPGCLEKQKALISKASGDNEDMDRDG